MTLREDQQSPVNGPREDEDIEERQVGPNLPFISSLLIKSENLKLQR